MALDFIPTVWAARLLVALEKAHIYAQPNICNRDYEGEIKKSGNTVKIASISEVAVEDYVKDTDINDPASLTDTEQTLLIDQAKYFNFFVDSVDRAQQNVNLLDEAMRRAAWTLREHADKYIASSSRLTFCCARSTLSTKKLKYFAWSMSSVCSVSVKDAGSFMSVSLT